MAATLSNGRTALMQAAMSGTTEAVPAVVELGVADWAGVAQVVLEQRDLMLARLILCYAFEH